MFIILCFFSVFMALVEFALINFIDTLVKNRKRKEKEREDREKERVEKAKVRLSGWGSSVANFSGRTVLPCFRSDMPVCTVSVAA